METDFQNDRCIIVPTDFSEVCDNALNHAIELAKTLACKIYVLHVFENKSKDSLIADYLHIDTEFDAYQNYEDMVCKVLLKYIKSKRSNNLYPIVREGELFSTIAATATELYAQLVILGTHGKIGFQNIFVSNALQVIDLCEVPVIIVQKRISPNGFKHIIFPVSLEDEDRQKTEYAIKLAKICNSTIHIFSHTETKLYNQHKLNTIISQIASYLEANKVKHEIIQVENYGDTWERQILNYSASIVADLILIISNPKKHHIFFNAKEETILFNSGQIPVMCVNYKKTKISSFCSGLTSGNS